MKTLFSDMHFSAKWAGIVHGLYELAHVVIQILGGP